MLPRSLPQDMIVLGIESSCDETAAALVRSDRTILAERIASQDDEHRPFGGVVPEIAARAHVERLAPLIAATLADAGMALADVDAIAATAGPGLIGGVMVGLVTAKALAMAADKPLLAINHLEGHALSPRLADAALDYPYLLLLVSGGHCQLLLVMGVGRYRRLATTIDDALGEAFDKTAKILGLGYPGGPAVERLAAQGNARAVALPRPLLGSSEPHFSFAGLKSAVMRAKQAQGAGDYSDADLAAAFQQAAIDCVIDRTRRALAHCAAAPRKSSLAGEGSSQSETEGARLGVDVAPGGARSVSPAGCHLPRRGRILEGSDVRRDALAAAAAGDTAITALVVAGGVAANVAVRSALAALAAAYDLRFVAPPLALCTDNAAMIAWAGVERLALGQNDSLDCAARPRWPLDPDAVAVRGAGVKA